MSIAGFIFFNGNLKLYGNGLKTPGLAPIAFKNVKSRARTTG